MKIVNEDIGKEMYGRLMSYNRAKGYGYIRTESGMDIYVSSYEFGKSERKAAVGAFVKFTVVERNGEPIAKKVSVLKKFNKGISKLQFPSGITIPIKNICKLGRANGFERACQNGITFDILKEHCYAVRDLDYIYVNTPDGSYSFFRKGGPATGDGQLDIEPCYKRLKDFLHGIHAEDFELVREEEAAGITAGRDSTKVFVVGEV